MREPGSLTIAFGVGFLFFATTPQKTETPLEWAGTHLRAFPARLQAKLAAG
jgi:hypothetical protein